MSSDVTDDAQVLDPDGTCKIAGESITVRRFRFRESLRAARIAQPIINALSDLQDDASMDDILLLLAEHEDAWFQLLSMSTGRQVAWLADLDEADGYALAMTFWSVHQDFFTRRLLMRGLNRGLESALLTSSANSSPPDSETSTPSPTDTPGRSSTASGAGSGDSGGETART